jgi:hypothetical protein
MDDTQDTFGGIATSSSPAGAFRRRLLAQRDGGQDDGFQPPPQPEGANAGIPSTTLPPIPTVPTNVNTPSNALTPSGSATYDPRSASSANSFTNYLTPPTNGPTPGAGGSPGQQPPDTAPAAASTGGKAWQPPPTPAQGWYRAPVAPGGNQVDQNGNAGGYANVADLYAKRGIANATQNPDGTWNSDAADPTSHPYEAPPAATDFSKWTEDQKAMYAAGMGGTGLLTDALRAKGQFKDGSNVASYGAADQSASDADLKARAMSDPTVAAALKAHFGAMASAPPRQALTPTGLAHSSGDDGRGVGGLTASGPVASGGGDGIVPQSGGFDPNALMTLLKQFQDSQDGAAKSREQKIQDLMGQFVTPGSQSTANNEDAHSAVTSIDPTNDLRGTVITDTPDARTADYQRRVDDAAANLPSNRAQMAQGFSDNLLNQIGNTSTDVGKDYTGALNSADQSVQDQLAKVTGTDRQALVDKLMKQYGDYLGPTQVQMGGSVAPTTSARLAALQGNVDTASSNLAGVDRYKLAQDKFGTYSDQTDPAFQLALRSAAQRAAAGGRSVSGMANTSYGDLALQRTRDLANERSSLFQNALDGSISDQFNKTNTLSGLEGQLTAQEANQRGEQRTERGYKTDVNTGNVNRGLSARETAAGMASSNADNSIANTRAALSAAQGVSSDLSGRQQNRIANQGANIGRRVSAQQYATGMGIQMADSTIGDARTNLATMSGLENNARSNNLQSLQALRGERGYQVGQESSAFQRMLAQRQQQNNEKQQQFSNGLQLLGAGDAGNPAGTLGGIADSMKPGVDPQMLATLMAQMGKNSVPGAGGAPAGTPAGGGQTPAAIQSILSSIFKGGIPGVQQTGTSGAPAGGVNGINWQQFLNSMGGNTPPAAMGQ